jgi:GNAT superfamily N-acetyltransferase
MSAQACAGTAVARTAPVPAGGLPARPVGTGGGLIRVRRAVPDDREALARMFDRCTLATRYRRFHGPVKAIPERYLAEALSGGPFHYALVAYAGSPDSPRDARPRGAVALGSCRTVGEGQAELGLLIEDAWQRRGLGTRLLRDLITHAGQAGLRVLDAQLLAEQAWITGLLRPYGTCRLHSARDGVLNVTVRLAPTPPLDLGPLRAPQNAANGLSCSSVLALSGAAPGYARPEGDNSKKRRAPGRSRRAPGAGPGQEDGGSLMLL